MTGAMKTKLTLKKAKEIQLKLGIGLVRYPNHSWVAVFDDESVLEPKELRLLSSYSSIHHIEFGMMNGISDGQLSSVLAFTPDATRICIDNGEALTDSSIPILHATPNLKRLEIGRAGVSDSFSKIFQGLHSLEFVSLQTSQVTDDFVLGIPSHHNLRVLDLEGANLSDRCFRHLATFDSMRLLGLSHTGITDTGLREFKKHRGMVGFLLSRNNVSDASFSVFESMTALLSVDLRGTKVTRNSAESFASKRLSCEVMVDDRMRGRSRTCFLNHETWASEDFDRLVYPDEEKLGNRAERL